VIGLFIKIPFHTQLRKAEPALAAELSGAVDDAISAFAAERQITEESFLLTFDETSRPCRLRAAEAARSLSSKISILGQRLHGWAVILDAGSKDPDDALQIVRRLWFGVSGDGFYVSTRSKSYFADYFQFGPAAAVEESDPECRSCSPVLDAIYARPALPDYGPAQGAASDPIEEAQQQTIDRLVDALGDLGIGEDAGRALAVFGQGRGPSLCLEASLARLYADSSKRFLRLTASAVESSPYGPIASALGALVSLQRREESSDALLSGAERGLLEGLAPMLDFLRRSPYRRSHSSQINIRLSLCAAVALGLYSRTMRANGLPAFVILERIEDFPAPSLDLIRSLVAGQLSSEGIMLIAVGADLPRYWKGPAPRSLEAPGPSPSAIAHAALRASDAMCAPGSSAILALASAGDPLRFKLAIRLLASGREFSASAATEILAKESLATLPREYAEVLLALRLGEGVLTDDFMETFFRDSGYVTGIRSIIYKTLAKLGFITEDDRPRIISSLAASRCEEALPDRGSAFRESFAARLFLLRDEGLIIPSSALFRRMCSEAGPISANDADKLRLALDCVSADAVYGPSEPLSDGPDERFLKPMADFLASYSASDREASIDALERLEADATGFGANDALAETAADLARAALEYSDGRLRNAAARAKNALIGLHALGAGKTEARAHRLLGLCALAQEQVQEGADYLSNAYDIASAFPEPLECILSAIAEAAAHFTLGDLGRARSRAGAAASWATSSFRPDWESVCAFIEGRAAFEVGRYDRAEESFGIVRSIARVYGQDEASRRAEIWTGHAAAFRGDVAGARRILRRFGDDAEALWFLAELEVWEGAPEKAMALTERALAVAPRRGFVSADAFDWSSGYASIEGRSVGFFAARTFLYDQIEAFSEFAAGMSDPGARGIASAERLASLAREDRLSTLHPSVHLYHFYRYLILERAAPSSMEGASALSKAFKALQLRSTKLEEAALKDGFLDNRWNRVLLEAARSRKLI